MLWLLPSKGNHMLQSIGITDLFVCLLCNGTFPYFENKYQCPLTKTRFKTAATHVIKKQNWSKVQYFCYKRKGNKFNYHYSDMEITKGHIKAAAQIFHFQSRWLGQRKVCKYFYFTLRVNIRCLGLTQKHKCPGASHLLASTSLWEPIV